MTYLYENLSVSSGIEPTIAHPPDARSAMMHLFKRNGRAVPPEFTNRAICGASEAGKAPSVYDPLPAGQTQRIGS